MKKLLLTMAVGLLASCTEVNSEAVQQGPPAYEVEAWVLALRPSGDLTAFAGAYNGGSWGIYYELDKCKFAGQNVFVSPVNNIKQVEYYCVPVRVNKK